ncbi:hypothetical protein [Fuscovulum blasticum]|uniref:hypothetical protein n=1 Tax=Fuscovulum blasticum TaxID=1075 RepID=UPI000D3EBF27|nr:hypothetical protein [Fuscovulum blasticum]AWD22895.1 hypothetical protein B6K69_15405 [Fuscovulum blasticum]
MRAVALALILALPAVAATADDVPMTGAEFDAYVTGKTLTYSQFGSVFGIEEYLPGRKVRWKFTADDCQYGSWYEKGDLICFVYEYDPDEHCWTFWTDGGKLKALSVDNAPGEELTEVARSPEGLNCPGPDVGV